MSVPYSGRRLRSDINDPTPAQTKDDHDADGTPEKLKLESKWRVRPRVVHGLSTDRGRLETTETTGIFPEHLCEYRALMQPGWIRHLSETHREWQLRRVCAEALFRAWYDVEVARLPRRQREAWQYASWGHNQPEIAEIMGIAQSNVSTYLAKAKEKLSERLNPLLDSPGAVWAVAENIAALAAQGQSVADLGWQFGLDVDTVRTLIRCVRERNEAVAA